MSDIEKVEREPPVRSDRVMTMAEESAFREIFESSELGEGMLIFDLVASYDDPDGVAESLRTQFAARIQDFGDDAETINDQVKALDALVEIGLRNEARRQAERYMHGVEDLLWAETLLSPLLMGDDDAARWARTRLRLAAFVSALHNPDKHAEIQRHHADYASASPSSRPRIGILVKTWRHLRGVIDRVSADIGRRIDVRVRMIDDIVNRLRADDPGDNGAWGADGVLLAEIAHHLLEAANGPESWPSLPAVTIEHDGEWTGPTIRKGDTGWRDALPAELRDAAGVTAAAHVAEVLATDERVLSQVAQWAAEENLLDGLMARRFIASWLESYGAVGAEFFTLQELAVLEGRKDVANGSAEALLAWALEEEVIDENARDVLVGHEQQSARRPEM